MRTAAEDEQVIPVEKQAAGPMGSGSGSSGARLESGRGVCGGAAKFRVRSASRARPVRAGCDRGRAARDERIPARARVRSVRGSGRAGVLAVVGFVRRACPRVGIPCDVATMAWPRRLIVSGFLTISSASVQRVHAILGIRGAPGGAGGAWSCRRQLLGWGQVRVRLVRGPRAGGDAGSCRASGSFGSITYFCPRMRIRRRARFGGLRPARLRAVSAARLGAGITDPDGRARRFARSGWASPDWLGNGAPTPLRPAIQYWTWRDSLLAGGWWPRRPDGRSRKGGNLAESRNIV